MATLMIKDAGTPDSVQDASVTGLFEHQDELRKRTFRSLLAMGIGMAVAVAFTNPMLNYTRQTYGDQLLILDPTDSIVTY